eukprot:g1728.t1
MIASGKRVVFVTGAGVSVASGIPTFRGPDGVWSSYLMEWGTRAAFLRDPTKWYNSFWLPAHEKVLSTPRSPNPGHEALGRMLQRSEHCTLVTQNIDRLHALGGAPPSRTVEVHGRHGLWKCVKTPQCPYATTESLEGLEYSYGPDGNVTDSPTCLGCGEAVMPQALFFDELYQSHSFYRWSDVEAWFARAEAFAFVGTSFPGIGVLEDALACAAEGQLPTFNLYYDVNGELAERLVRKETGKTTNKKRKKKKKTSKKNTNQEQGEEKDCEREQAAAHSSEPVAIDDGERMVQEHLPSITHILGKAEELLPRLAELVDQLIGGGVPSSSSCARGRIAGGGGGSGGSGATSTSKFLTRWKWKLIKVNSASYFS